MLNKKKIALIVGVIFIIIMSFIFGRYQCMKIKGESFIDLQNKLKEASKVNSDIDIKKLTNFPWDECYVFTPYYPSKSIYEKVGTEWTTSKTFISFLMFHHMEIETVNDDEFLMVFKKDNKVVLSQIYSLNQLPVIFKLDNDKFTYNNSKFLVTVSKLYDEGKIKELILKK